MESTVERPDVAKELQNRVVASFVVLYIGTKLKLNLEKFIIGIIRFLKDARGLCSVLSPVLFIFTSLSSSSSLFAISNLLQMAW